MQVYSRKIQKKNISTFSVGYDQDFIKALQMKPSLLGNMLIEFNQNIMKKIKFKQFLDFLPKWFNCKMSQLQIRFAFLLYHLSKLAKKNGVTVCQVGEGADELFFGYPLWRTKLKLQSLNNFPFMMPIKKLGLFGLNLFGKNKKLTPNG